MASHDWVKVKPLSFIYIRSKKESYVSFYLNSQTFSLSLYPIADLTTFPGDFSGISHTHTSSIYDNHHRIVNCEYSGN